MLEMCLLQSSCPHSRRLLSCSSHWSSTPIARSLLLCLRSEPALSKARHCRISRVLTASHGSLQCLLRCFVPDCSPTLDHTSQSRSQKTSVDSQSSTRSLLVLLHLPPLQQHRMTTSISKLLIRCLLVLDLSLSGRCIRQMCFPQSSQTSILSLQHSDAQSRSLQAHPQSRHSSWSRQRHPPSPQSHIPLSAGLLALQPWLLQPSRSPTLSLRSCCRLRSGLVHCWLRLLQQHCRRSRLRFRSSFQSLSQTLLLFPPCSASLLRLCSEPHTSLAVLLFALAASRLSLVPSIGLATLRIPLCTASDFRIPTLLPLRCCFLCALRPICRCLPCSLHSQ